MPRGIRVQAYRGPWLLHLFKGLLQHAFCFSRPEHPAIRQWSWHASLYAMPPSRSACVGWIFLPWRDPLATGESTHSASVIFERNERNLQQYYLLLLLTIFQPFWHPRRKPHEPALLGWAAGGHLGEQLQRGPLLLPRQGRRRRPRPQGVAVAERARVRASPSPPFKKKNFSLTSGFKIY